MKHLEHSLEIDADAEEIWSVLTDFDTFPEWNPFVRSIAGDCATGARLAVTIEPPHGRAIRLRPVVQQVDPARELRWLGKLGVPHVFDGEHCFRLEPLAGGRTRFTQSEDFRGILVPFTSGVLTKTGEGFRLMNEALADEVLRRRSGQAEGSHPASWMASATTGTSSSSTWRNSKPASSA
jgi:hypothetical protein